MKKNFISKACAAIALASALTACAPQEQHATFHISGTTGETVADSTLLFLTDSKGNQLDSCLVVEGAFTFSGNADSVMVTAIGCPGQRPKISFFAEEGNISIDLTERKATGTPLNDDYTQFIAHVMSVEDALQEEAEKNAPSLKAAQEMLFKWENGDQEVVELWKTMNGWVYEGFDKTYADLGISFDRTYYESQTYLFGKALVQKGLEAGIFERQEDGSVWCDLTADGLDRKLLLRGDGTSVYMTQDLGTAEQRFAEYSLDEHIYVVGNEQNYHFQVLKLILGKLGFDWADSIYHLSYGMVELPEGKMKSREGTVVDADDLIAGMYNTAKETSL